jgi:predicted metal-dependent HD superfamily phosphohydrolase
MPSALLRDWHRIFPADETVGADLLRRWAEPHRRYHNLTHLSSVLTVVEQHAAIAEDADAVRLAAWFHDAVYDPRADDNEERSAALAERILPDLGLSPERVTEVGRLVRLTAGHEVDPGDRNGSLLADADLAILSATPREYDAYTRAVREEYGHVPDEQFRIGRATVLQRLVSLPALYRIVPQRAAWTAKAHANLRRELSVLLDV